MTHAKRLVALTVALALVTPGFAADPHQSAPVPDRAAIEAREAAIFPTAVREVRSERGIVAGTASPIAVEAGAQVLREGGTAADAAATTALVQVTTMLGANVSPAGVLQLVYYEARTGKVHVLDAGWGTWRGETSPATIPDTDLSLVTGRAATLKPGPAGRKMLVPGFMAGIEAMHTRFGRLPFRRLFDPAIWYADHGVPVTGLLAAYFSIGTAKLMETPEGRRFAKPGGADFPKLGERYLQPELANLYKAVAAHGAREMYRGRWARHYVDAVRSAGGAAAMADMRAYAPRWGKPLETAFDGATVMGPDARNTSSCAALEALNLIGHAKAVGEAEAFRATALALRVAIFSHWGPAAAAFEKAAGIGGSCTARMSPAYGSIASGAMETMLGGTADPAPEGHHSASVVVVDRWGNVAALVHSSNTAVWGDSGMVVDGVPLPVPASNYRHLLVGLTPGARVPSDMAPVIVLQGGKPVLAVATIGSSVVPETVRLVATLGRPGSLAAILGAPPLLLNYEEQSLPLMGREEFVPAGRYSPAMLNAVRAGGLRVREVDAQRALYVRGTAAVARIGGGDRRSAEVPGVLTFAAAE
ncbi:gamma-glutamyltransferase family protein [Sphingomonas sp. LB-2]|nr:gamma-glutamyltransferase family protein [Sphingomonas caeni]